MVGRIGWDEGVVWKEWVRRRWGLEKVGGMEEVVWEEWVGRKCGLGGVGGRGKTLHVVQLNLLYSANTKIILQTNKEKSC